MGRLAIIMLGGLCAVAAMQCWLLTLAHQRSVDIFAVRAANRAKANANHVESIFRQVDLVLRDMRGHVDTREVLAGHEALAPGRYAEMRRILVDRLAHLPRLRHAHIAGPDGLYVFSTLEGRPRVSIADRSYFRAQAAAMEDELIVARPLIGRVVNTLGVFSSRRLATPDGAFAGIVIAAMDSESLSDELQAIDRDAWSMVLVSDEGIIAANQPKDTHALGTVIDAALRAGLADEKPSWIGPGPGGAEFIWGHAHLSGMPYAVISGYPVERALALWRSELHAHIAALILLAAGGVVVLLLSRRRERTEARATDLDRRLRTSEHALADLGARVPVGVFRLTIGRDGPRLDYANARCSDILGGLPADHASLLAIVHADDRAPLATAFAEAPQRGALSWTGRILVSGRERFIEVQAGAVASDGGIHDWSGIIQDVTERRHLEEQLHQSEKMRAVGLLAGGVAHDFNNILAGIAGFAELAIRRRPPPPVDGHLAQIAAGADRAKTLVQQILAFSRRSPGERKPVHLQSTVREVVNLMRATVPASVTMCVDLEADVGPVLADPGRIHQLVMNLCGNAVHAMGGRGELRIRLERAVLAVHSDGRIRTLPPGPYARLIVTDTGCGMDAATLRRIFEPFFTTKGPDEGTGLGLAVVWTVVDTHGGDLAVDSTPGVGTTFRILLPVIAQPVSATPPTELAALPRGSERILIVDDEPALRELLCETFAGLGYRVTACPTAAEALRLLQDRPAQADLVITDQTMPGMSGRELGDAIARLHPGLPLVLCSGLDVPGHIDGPDRRFCAKPVNSEALAVLVRRMLDRSA